MRRLMAAHVFTGDIFLRLLPQRRFRGVISSLALHPSTAGAAAERCNFNPILAYVNYEYAV